MPRLQSVIHPKVSEKSTHSPKLGLLFVGHCWCTGEDEIYSVWRNVWQLRGVHVFFRQLHWICDELHWLSPRAFVMVQPRCYAFVNNFSPRHSAAPLKLSLRPRKRSRWDEIRSETVDSGNDHLKPLSLATKRFKWNGNDLTLITSWLVMTLISSVFFPVDRIMTSSF